MNLHPDAFFDFAHTEHRELFDELNYPWEILPLLSEFIAYALSEKNYYVNADISRAAFVDDNVAIGEGTVIEPGAIIHGPTIIGKNCLIRTNAYIRGNAVIGNNSIIGNSTEIKNSFLFDAVTAPHFNYIGDAVLGYKVHLGSGAVLSNIKTPPSSIMIRTLEETIDTGLEKFSAIVGDFTEIGSNAVIAPGTLIGKHVTIYPLSLIRGIVPENTIVKLRQQQQVVLRRGLT